MWLQEFSIKHGVRQENSSVLPKAGLTLQIYVLPRIHYEKYIYTLITALLSAKTSWASTVGMPTLLIVLMQWLSFQQFQH